MVEMGGDYVHGGDGEYLRCQSSILQRTTANKTSGAPSYSRWSSSQPHQVICPCQKGYEAQDGTSFLLKRISEGDWGEVSTYINPCRSCLSLRLLQDVLWQTVRCSSCLWKRCCTAMTPLMQLCGKWFVWIMMLELGWGNGTDTQQGWNILCLKRMSSLLILNAFAWLNV